MSELCLPLRRGTCQRFLWTCNIFAILSKENKLIDLILVRFMLLLKNNERLETKMLKTAFSVYSNVELFIIMWISQPMFFAAQDFYFGAFHYKMHVWHVKIVLFMVGCREVNCEGEVLHIFGC